MRKINFKVTIFYFLVFSIVVSCQIQEYGESVFDLEKLSFTLNVEKFYKKSMEGSIREMNHVEKDTINEYDLDWNGDRNKIVGIEYNVKSYSPQNCVAKFQELNFTQLESITTEEGDLMLISATGNISPHKVENTIKYLTKKYKAPVIEIKEFSFFKSYHYTWVLNDRIIQIVTGKELDFEQTGNIIEEDEKEMILEIEEDKLTETHLFICNQSFVEKLKGVLNSGNWSDFK